MHISTQLLLMTPLSLTDTYLHAGDVGIRGLVRHTDELDTRDTGPGVAHVRIIYSYIPPSLAAHGVQSLAATSDEGPV